MRPPFTALALAILAAGASPAFAQAPAPSEKMNMVIVYGKDACPESREGEITVCARKDEAERYRIPPSLRGSESPQNEAWTNRVQSYEMVGASGTQSCSPTGPGGWTGCANRFIQNAYAEKKQGTDVHFSEMLAKEREKRAATVDADAAATQARVEQAEKDYEARQRAQAESAEAAKNAPPAPAPTPAK
ncbi:MAG: hypothetical protein KGM17_14175 [Sphingomonadales bacterium]|nr:hypothetical protein [Sphingomonadales bacterium]